MPDIEFNSITTVKKISAREQTCLKEAARIFREKYPKSGITSSEKLDEKNYTILNLYHVLKYIEDISEDDATEHDLQMYKHNVLTQVKEGLKIIEDQEDAST